MSQLVRYTVEKKARLSDQGTTIPRFFYHFLTLYFVLVLNNIAVIQVKSPDPPAREEAVGPPTGATTHRSTYEERTQL